MKIIERGVILMILEDIKYINIETEDDRSIKIFNKANYEDELMYNDEVLLDNDDSNIKIFIMS